VANHGVATEDEFKKMTGSWVTATKVITVADSKDDYIKANMKKVD